MARQRWRRERWISVVQEFEDSGLTQREFAQRHRLKLPTFRSWLYRLRQEEGPEEQPLRFVEITGTESNTASHGATTVGWPGGPQAVFNELPEAEYVATLLRSLVESSEC